MIPLTLVLRKVRAVNDLDNGNGLVNHLLFMDDLRLYGRNESQLDSLIQSEIFGSKTFTQYGQNFRPQVIAK